MQPNITFIKGQGGLGRSLPGQDFISAFLFYVATLPSGFSANNRIKALYSVSDAEAAGIKGDYSDGTAAVATYTVTAMGADGNTLTLTSTELKSDGTTVSTLIGTYKKATADNTLALVAAGIAAAVNAGTSTHGYSASAAAAAVSIVAPKNQGIFLNTGTPLTAVATGTLAGTIVQFTGGAASKLKVFHYHISEFFRMQPKGVLYVGFFAVPATYDFTEITTIQNFAGGAIRQIGVYKDAIFSTGDITALDIVCKANDDAKKPLSSLYAADLSATTDISVLSDLSTLTANKVTVVIGQDGSALGNFLFKTLGKSITVLGAQLGTIALSKVSESIAWVGQFNISNGTECEVLAFANGQLLTGLADGLLTQLNDKRYTFLKKFVGLSGSYFNDSHTAIIASSDYAQIENNRTIDKAIRLLYAALLPKLNSPLQLEKSGSLTEATAAALESTADTSLDGMIRDGELSEKNIIINPNQNVLSTSLLVVAVELIVNGVARYIQVPIGFKAKIS